MKIKMTEVKFYDTVEDELLKFAVIISKSNGKWVFCKHKERNTFEFPGGHRENKEDIFDTAKSGGTACLCMGGMQQRDDAYVVVAFCDWKQSELAPGELLRCYTSVPDRNNYEEIRFPDIKEDAVYQI